MSTIPMTASSPSAPKGAGVALAERLGLTIIGTEGHDLKVACVLCQSSDAGRVHQDSGVFHCYSCGKSLNGFDLAKVVLKDHPAAIQVMVDVGLFEDWQRGGGNGRGKPAAAGKSRKRQSLSTSPTSTDPTEADEAGFFAVCAAKRMPPAAVKQFGGVPYRGGVKIPMWGADLRPCSSIHITPENGKGMNAKGKSTGLFLPGRSPEPSETWIIVEGPKDGAALYSLGFHNVAGLPQNHLNWDFAELFKDVDVIRLPDADKAGIEGARADGKTLRGIARSFKIALLPSEVKESHGEDVRDILHRLGADGPAAIKQAIDEAKPVEETGETGEAPAPVDYGLITAGELLQQNYPIEQLVKGALVKTQHTLLGGPLKSCKSLVAVDLAVALAAGVPWLGHFEVPRPVRTILFSGECGWPIVQESVRRIIAANGAAAELLAENLLVGVRLPKFGRTEYMQALAEVIGRHHAEVAILDCAYRAIPGDEVSNLFAMGELLDSVGRVFEESGATLVLLHHSPKHIPPGDPLQLDNLAFAGFAEFAAGWLLLNRQKPFEPGSGHHDMWLTVGARAGIGGTFGLMIDEGEYHEGQDRGWQVSVEKATDTRAEKREEQQRTREAKRQEKMKEVKKRILEAAAKYRGGETSTTIRDRAGLHDHEFKPALADLLENGDLLPVEIQKSNRQKPYVGYILPHYAKPTQRELCGQDGQSIAD